MHGPGARATRSVHDLHPEGTATDAPFTLVLASADGRIYSCSTGTSTSTSSYESASTSKLVTAVVILSLIDQGKRLDAGFQASGPDPVLDPDNRITSRRNYAPPPVSFTSGFETEPVPDCLDSGTRTFTPASGASTMRTSIIIHRPEVNSIIPAPICRSQA